ncbi:D-lactate dehydrogenase [Pleomassaria siparia CBS 279.74]|uniref:D-lactate dehydrogenase (cytochrome) n=1 Tax=Pleomassaria siparia CBS 279.74 TaxID=1314801 RepID=A0A6G1K0V5_9PLEO|nr:D-lactate dehydrogenase [Pleomassaria siparia CBS 279.74]
MSCSGTNAYRYGTIKQHILSLTLVLADGTIIKTRNRPRKSSAGYDLGSLIIGSEGTLALVTEAILKITPLPQNLHVGLVTFESLQDGVDVALGVLRSGMQLEALELADRSCMYAINRSGLAASSSSSSSSSSPLVFEEKPTLFLKVAGSAQSVREQMEFVTKLCTQHGALHTEFTHEKARIEELWGARKCLGHALVAMKQSPSDLFLSTDAAVPVSALARLVRESEALVRTQGSPAWFTASVGHVGDGNVHTAIVCPQEAKEEAEDLLDKIRRLALELDGTITGEHGIGLKLRDLLSDEVGVQGVDLMRKIKFALDPRAILNPDKVVRLEVGV